MSDLQVKGPKNDDNSSGAKNHAQNVELRPAASRWSVLGRLRSAKRNQPVRPYVPTTEAKMAKDSLAQVQVAWQKYQGSRRRDAVYIYLDAVYEAAGWWKEIGRAKAMCRAALQLQPSPRRLKLEPFGVAIFCSSPQGTVDEKTRSKWSRALRVAERFKRRDESFTAFVKRHGGINKAAARFYELTD